MVNIQNLNRKTNSIQKIKNKYPILFQLDIINLLISKKGKSNHRKAFIQDINTCVNNQFSYEAIQKWFIMSDKYFPNRFLKSEKILTAFSEILFRNIQKQSAYYKYHGEKYADLYIKCENVIKKYNDGQLLPIQN